MASKSYYRQRIAELRYQLAKEREYKKRDNESWARSIRGASSASTKASYRRNKLSVAGQHDRRIQSLREEIERQKSYMRNAR